MKSKIFLVALLLLQTNTLFADEAQVEEFSEDQVSKLASALGCRMFTKEDHTKKDRILSEGCTPPYFVVEKVKDKQPVIFVWCHPKDAKTKKYYIQIINHKFSDIAKGCPATIDHSDQPCSLSINNKKLFSGMPDEAGEFFGCKKAKKGKKGEWKSNFVC